MSRKTDFNGDFLYLYFTMPLLGPKHWGSKELQSPATSVNEIVYEKHAGEQTNWQSPHSGVIQAGGMQSSVPNWFLHIFTHRAAPALRLDLTLFLTAQVWCLPCSVVLLSWAMRVSPEVCDPVRGGRPGVQGLSDISYNSQILNYVSYKPY